MKCMVYVGLDPELATDLSAALRRWELATDDIVYDVQAAEAVAEIRTGVILPLHQIADDGSRMATHIDQAVEQATRYQLLPADTGSMLALIGFRLDGPGQQADERYAIEELFAFDPNWRESLDRIDELRGEIERDSAAGRDTSSKFKELRKLLTVVTAAIGPTDVVPGALAARVDTSTSLVLSGVAAAELLGGPERVLEKVAAAMANGRSPAEAGLPEAVFAASYIEWHRRALEIAAIEDELAFQAKALDAFGDLDIGTEQRGSLRDQIEALDLSAAERARLIAWFAASIFDASVDERHPAAAILAAGSDRLRQELVSLAEVQANVVVDTPHGDAAIGDDGRLSRFDAIGATALMVPQLPMTFLGHSYAAGREEFEFHQVEQALALIAESPAGATAFFEELGAEDAALFLEQLQLRFGFFGYDNDWFVSSEIGRDISIALGTASPFLPTEFAADLVSTRPTVNYPTVSRSATPDMLFAYGDFAPGFLVAGAAASIGLYTSGAPQSPRSRNPRRPDPRAVLLNRVVQDGLAVALIMELDGRGLLDEFVFTATPVSGAHLDLTENPYPTMPLISGLFLQAGLDDAASALLIQSAGSRIDELHIDVANGLSQVLAGQVANYVGVDGTHAYFDAVQNIFAAGAGIDIRIATEMYLANALDDGFQNGDPGWWGDLEHVGAFAGHIEGRDWIVHGTDARARDRSIARANRWITGVTALVGAGLAVASLPFVPISGGTSLAVTGIFVSLAGGSTLLLDDADDWERHLAATRDRALGIHPAGEATVLLSLLRIDSIQLPAGSVSVRQGATRVELVIERADGLRTLIGIDPADPSWAPLAIKHLDAAGATVGSETLGARLATGSAIAIVNDAFEDGYTPVLVDATEVGG